MNESIRKKIEIADSEEATEDILLELAGDEDYRVRSCVAWNDNASEKVFIALKDDDCLYRVLENIVNEGNTLSPNLVEELCSSNKPLVRRIAAYNPNCSVNNLEVMSQDPSEHVRIAAAANPKTPVKMLAKLAHDKEDIVRRKVARNPSTTKEILIDMVTDSNYQIRRLVAANEKLPVEYIVSLAKDEEGYVRYGAAINPNAPNDLLEDLSNDKFFEVRLNVIFNKKTPIHIVEKLLDDELFIVRERAKEELLARNKESSDKKTFTEDKQVRKKIWDLEKIVRNSKFSPEKRISAINEIDSYNIPEARDSLYNIATDGFLPDKFSLEALKRIKAKEKKV